MRFGRTLYLHQIPQWSPSYLDYDKAKILFKTALISAGKDETKVDFTELFRFLERDIATVESFYIKQYDIIHRTLEDDFRRYGIQFDDIRNLWEQVDVREAQITLGCLIDSRDVLEQLLCWTLIIMRLEDFIYAYAVPLLVTDQAKAKLLLYHAVSQDNVSGMEKLLRGCDVLASKSKGHSITLLLLDYSLMQGADRCVAYLSSQMSAKSDGIELETSNLLHHLAIRVGRMLRFRQKASQVLPNGLMQAKGEDPPGSLLIQKLSSEQPLMLQEKDAYGRLPLHYAAEYGLSGLCVAFLEHLSWLDAVCSSDTDRITPLHLAVISGSTLTTKALLNPEAQNLHVRNRRLLGRVVNSCLIIAVKLDNLEIIRMLLDHGADTAFQDACGATPLYYAARKGIVEITEFLVERRSQPLLAINLTENIHGRSPLIIACVEGHLQVVKLLLSAGADSDLRDVFGWTAKEHAVFRGHMRIAQLLPTFAWHVDNTGTQALRGLRASLCKRSAAGLAGHGCREYTGGPNMDLSGQTKVLVTLGPSNTRKTVESVDLARNEIKQTYASHAGFRYSLQIMAIGAEGPSQSFDLPVLRDLTNEPTLFGTNDPNNVKLIFNLHRIVDLADESENGKVLVGRCIALLHDLQETIGSKHNSLYRDYTIPIMNIKSLEYMGNVTFSFVMVTPFAHEACRTSARQGFWKQDGLTQVVGHRGAGANTSARTNLQIGENTIQSFLTANALGASCVEFDVQLTKDFRTAIFHDFLVMATGGDVPLHTLTLDQFMHLGRLQAPKQAPSGMAKTHHLENLEEQNDKNRRPRSLSYSLYDYSSSNHLMDWLKYTEEGIHNDIKGNLRGHSIHESPATLEQLLTSLPESVAFNVEIKYPMLWEAQDRDMDPYAFEINAYVDEILTTVCNLKGNRNITFSSFSPEICILLALKQQDHPILFINKAGSVPTGDVRAANTQQAIRFAKCWGLAGIVLLSDSFVMCPSLVGYAKTTGLVTGSYGNLNDDPKCAVIQAEAGLDAIMVNKAISAANSSSTMPHATTSPQARTSSKASRARQYLTIGGITREDSDDELGLEDHPWQWIYSSSTNPQSTKRNASCEIIGARMGNFSCRIGDCVLLKAEGNNEAWVGLICDFVEEEEDDDDDDDEGQGGGEMGANFMWFSTDREIRNKGKKRRDALPNEVYITPSWDVNPLASINGKATILSQQAFLARYPSGKVPRSSKDYGKIFVCRRGCNTRTAIYTEEFVWEDIYGGEDDIAELIQRVQSQTKVTRKKRKRFERDEEEEEEGGEEDLGDSYEPRDDIDEPRTPRKRRKYSQASTPTSKSKRSAQKHTTPTSKRIVLKKQLTITPLSTRFLSPSHTNSTPHQMARSTLHVSSVPTSLPCRQHEFSTVYEHLESAITAGSGACIYISGTPGTGKTATVREVVAQLNAAVQADELDDFIFVEINGMKVTDPTHSYSLLWEALRNERVSSTHALGLLEREFAHPSPRRVPCVVLMDELDQLVTNTQSVMYNFFNWPQLRHSRLIVLAVANTMDLPERTLSNKISSRLGLTRILFPGYTHEQLMEIVRSRLEQVSGDIVDKDAIQFAARKVAAVSGDARRCLEICRRAVEIAELEGLESEETAALLATPSKSARKREAKGEVPIRKKLNAGKVTIQTIKAAINEATSSPLQQYLKSLPLAAKLFLAALLARTRRTGVNECVLADVVEEAKRLAATSADNPMVHESLLRAGGDQVMRDKFDGTLRMSKNAPRVTGMGFAAAELAEAGVISLEGGRNRGERIGRVRLGVGDEEVGAALRGDGEVRGLGFG
ncbi:MAG: hypothetical protein Q9217_004736 [Psora testacea]